MVSIEMELGPTQAKINIVGPEDEARQVLHTERKVEIPVMKISTCPAPVLSFSRTIVACILNYYAQLHICKGLLHEVQHFDSSVHHSTECSCIMHVGLQAQCKMRISWVPLASALYSILSIT